MSCFTNSIDPDQLDCRELADQVPRCLLFSRRIDRRNHEILLAGLVFIRID